MTLFRPTFRFRAFSLALAPVIALAGCVDEGGGLFSSRDADADGPTPIGATRLVERDIEAPEVFEVSTEGLWDGRPTLGGVWVAHADVTDPERVIIRNDENGRFVIGTLFLRDRDNPGPDLQISSDAAAAIRALAGDPTMLNVTALRREEAPVSPAAAPDSFAPGTDITATGAADAVTAAPLEGDDSALATAPVPQPAAARAPVAGAPEQAYVQIGIFSVQENATNTGQALRRVGLEPTIYDQSTNGRQFWRVVVGPADSETTRDAILANARELGFEDAFFVRR